MIRNKKGWLRILEAFLAIVLISSVLMILYTKTIKPQRDDIYKLQKTILDEIAADPELRDAVINSNETKIKDFVAERRPYGFNSSIRICDYKDICGLPAYKQEVYSSERVIAANLQQYSPTKVKIFMWRVS